MQLKIDGSLWNFLNRNSFPWGPEWGATGSITGTVIYSTGQRPNFRHQIPHGSHGSLYLVLNWICNSLIFSVADLTIIVCYLLHVSRVSWLTVCVSFLEDLTLITWWLFWYQLILSTASSMTWDIGNQQCRRLVSCPFT